MEFSEEITDEIFKIFQVESEEIISKMNNNLLNLEKNPKNKDLIIMLFRDAHSLKGASRMIGFNNVQTIAHKIEDVLGLAKDNKILLNSKIVDILYKTVDFLSELIQKSLIKKQEIYSEKISKRLSILDNIKDYAENVNQNIDKNDFDIELFTQNIDRINIFLPESLSILMNIESGTGGNLIPNLISVIKNLYDIFQKVGSFNIKNRLEDIIVKLDFTSKASNNLTTIEIEEIHKNLNTIISELASLCELHNFDLIDYYGIAFEKTSKIPPKIPNKNTEQNLEVIQPEVTIEIPSKEEVSEDIFLDLNLIKNKISDLLQNTSSITEIKDLLINYEKKCTNNNVKNILQKIKELLDFASKNEVLFNEEIISALRESIEHCDNVTKNEAEITDNELIFQRLEIIQQILNFNKEKNEIGNFISPSKSKEKVITDFSEVFNTGPIKTLRIDSLKLDLLINQINELTVTKIKTKKHLFELNIINEEVKEWQKNLTKLLNYLKHYDKKYTQSELNNNYTPFFTKQLLNLFTDNNKKVQKISSDITNLYRTIQEDNMKMNLTVDNLNNMVKNMRILPLATVFHLFGRMVRDIAQEKNKEIDFEIIGSETSADKKIIEEIKAPLIHIIRNAIDHGIETPEERVAIGKNPTGKIILSAKQDNNKVIIEIKDDGRGINLAKIKEKALKKGFLTQEEINSMSDEQITNVIFAPGFSTGDEITNISGRGIGLDVVQSKISQLNGKVKIISEINKGCCVQIELPTTMSIIKVFLVKSSNQTFAIPMEAINTVLRKKEDEIISKNNRKSIIFENETIPLIDLASILNLPKIFSDKDKKTILIIESDNKIMSVSVDELMGEQEVLLKKLSAPFYKLKKISGITTLISGDICLILNISEIINSPDYLKTSELTMKTTLNNSDFKILLVDDSATTRTLEKNILTKAGYNIELAENPIEAFEKMKNNPFDLIISDIEMPEMNGIEFLEKLKTNEMFSDIPVIILSSLNEEYKKLAIDLGAKKYIVKSEFNQNELQDAIIKILAERT